jgi:hypothetical protein
MRLLALILLGCLLLANLLGCEVLQSGPGLATAQVRVVAQPKAGAQKGFTHVAVYDVAPVPAVATGQFEHVDYQNLGDIIVWLEPSQGITMRPPGTLTVPVSQDRTDSKVIPVSVGQQLIFQNQSSRPVSLYSVSDGNEFDLKRLEPGDADSYTVRSPGVIEVLADPSRPPVAQLYSAPGPFVARTESGKTVTFMNVPPGSYQAMSWHPRLPGASAPIALTADQVSRCTLTVGVNNLEATAPSQSPPPPSRSSSY